jgi:chromosome transmission fidelity protein 4
MATGKAEFTKKKACSKIDTMAAERVMPAWHPDGGSFLAAPASDGSINFYERLSWDSAGELTGQHNAAVHLLSFSKNGLYLASTAADQSLVIWDVVERKALEKKTLPGTACGIAWHPTSNALSIITDDGELAIWTNPIPATLPSPTVDADALTGVKKMGDLNDTMIDDQAMDAGSDGEEDGRGHMSDDEYDREDSFLHDDGDDTTRTGTGTGNGTIRRSRKYSGHSRGRKHSGGTYYDAPAFSVMDLPQPQPPIQSGATSMDAGRRYLAYTSLGAITLRSEPDHNTVEVAFHDTARVRRRVPLLTDFFGFNLGALGERGAFYASPASSDAPSTLVYRPFDAWAPNSEWSLGLPEGEEAECIAAGTTFAAVATNKRMLRLFTAAGLQSGVVSLPGAAVAMAARGGKLAVAWHAAPPTPLGDQCIMLGEYAVQDQRLLRQSSVSLCPGATVAWMGYTEEGMLAVYDSEGVLRVLSPEFGGSWVPVFSAAAERRGGEHFWVFAVSIKRSEVQCIVCANTPEPAVPSGSARPVVTAAPIRVPVIAHDESQAPLEANLLRQGLLIAHTSAAANNAHSAGEVETDEEAAALEAALQTAQMDADRSALRLFTRLVQTDRQARALEVASALQTSAGLQGAIKIANHGRMSTLAEAVGDIIEQRAAAEEAAALAAAGGDTYGGMYASEEQHYTGNGTAAGPIPVPSPAFALHPGGSAKKAAAEAEAEENAQAGAAAKNVLVENGSPNGVATGGAKLGGAGKASTNGADAGAKRKAAPAGNPFARRKATKK